MCSIEDDFKRNPIGFMIASDRYSHKKRSVGKAELITLSREGCVCYLCFGGPKSVCLVFCASTSYERDKMKYPILDQEGSDDT